MRKTNQLQFERDLSKVLTYVRIEITRNTTEKHREALNEDVLDIAKMLIDGLVYKYYPEK